LEYANLVRAFHLILDFADGQLMTSGTSRVAFSGVVHGFQDTPGCLVLRFPSVDGGLLEM
jgi:hypothetical protein